MSFLFFPRIVFLSLSLFLAPLSPLRFICTLPLHHSLLPPSLFLSFCRTRRFVYSSFLYLANKIFPLFSFYSPSILAVCVSPAVTVTQTRRTIAHARALGDSFSKFSTGTVTPMHFFGFRPISRPSSLTGDRVISSFAGTMFFVFLPFSLSPSLMIPAMLFV